MNKYDLIAFFDASNTVFALGVITLSLIFKNYYILLLLLLVGTSRPLIKLILNNKTKHEKGWGE
jgi:hypothetical protein